MTLAILGEVLEPGARVLDVAGAQGNFSLALAEMGYRVTWNDLRGELADYVRLKHERGAVEYAPGNMFELRADTLFDAVLITEVIEHVAHPDQFLAQAAALVRPGGYVVMTTPNGRYFRNTLPKFSNARMQVGMNRSSSGRIQTAISSCCIRMKSMVWRDVPASTWMRSRCSRTR